VWLKNTRRDDAAITNNYPNQPTSTPVHRFIQSFLRLRRPPRTGRTQQVFLDEGLEWMHPLGVDLPAELSFSALYLAADHSSQVAQRRFLSASRLRLSALVAAAAFGTVTLVLGRVDLAGIGGAAALGTALVSEVYLLTVRPERRWYDARAAAESAKTLAWRYIVGGEPFGIEQADDKVADRLLLSRLAEITADLRDFAPIPLSEEGSQITDGMRKARSLSFEERRELYLVGRIRDQQAWYARRAMHNERRAAQWMVILAALEALGLVAAALRAAEVIAIDLAAVAGALAAAGVAWLQTRQHQTLASSYAVAAQELAGIVSRADWPVTESAWAHFVDEAEEAISREHTLWCASHS